MNKDLSFFGHVDALRGTLIKVVAAVFVCAIVVYAFIDPILAYLIRPVGQLVFTSPADAFVARLMLTIVGGLILALPFVLYLVWEFVAIGLKDHERRWIVVLAPASFVLFLIGALFAYFVIIPIALTFLLGFSNEMMQPMITVKNYISFVGSLILAFGVIFELPLVLMFLTKLGIATPEFLSQKRKYAVVMILIVSAVVTPPDVITQVLMALPLVILYELGILISRMVRRKSSPKDHVS